MVKRSDKLKVEVREQSKTPGFFGKILLRILPLLLAIVLLLGTAYFCRKKLYFNNSLFELKQIETSQSENFPRMRIVTMLSEMGIESGRQTLPLLPLAEIRQRFLKEPLAGAVQVRRIFPDTLQVRIVERIPVAYLHFPSRSRLSVLSIDRNGVVLPGEVKGASTKIPIINHIPNANNLVVGERTDNSYLLSVLLLLNQLAVRSEGAYYDVFLLQINQADQQLILRLNARGIFRQSAQIILSLDHIVQGLERLKHIVKLRMESGQTISFIDVSYEKNVPVRP
ncbi:MAG: FtsQ-type POTRA domain-containing protein [Lentisphaeria bacterium]